MNLVTAERTARTMLARGRSASAIGNYLDAIAELSPGTFPEPNIDAAWETARVRASWCFMVPVSEITPQQIADLALELMEYDPESLEACEVAFLSAVVFATELEVAHSLKGAPGDAD